MTPNRYNRPESPPSRILPILRQAVHPAVRFPPSRRKYFPSPASPKLSGLSSFRPVPGIRSVPSLSPPGHRCPQENTPPGSQPTDTGTFQPELPPQPPLRAGVSGGGGSSPVSLRRASPLTFRQPSPGQYGLYGANYRAAPPMPRPPIPNPELARNQIPLVSGNDIVQPRPFLWPLRLFSHRTVSFYPNFYTYIRFVCFFYR